MKDDLELFESPLLLIFSAKEDVPKLENGLHQWVQSCEHTIVRHRDPNTGWEFVRLNIGKPFPKALRVAAYRIVNDLRHALDQAVCDGSLMLGARSTRNTYFPFAKDPSDLDAEIKRKCKTVHPDLVNFIKQFKPYYGGDDELWALSHLCGPNKHARVIQLAASAAPKVNAGSIHGPIAMPVNIWNERRDQLEVLRIGPGGKLNMDLVIQFEIVVGPFPVIGGQPAIRVFNDLARKVEGIVLGIKAESARIKSQTI